ncbi:tripartite tricarboxylate transporter substrate binding protein [Pseudoroseomonas ludipueritiae]|uniref:Tripartite tricarboxylate transporter substrate binding protein n=1 Tax=Pseudoroseomonas ludipueritiae TaxID=198093 RepID=A0ABR7R9A2_9PROT|nr:tripartite tricarboxylate transporter substrate binding protein [Pseudoroseomonas ludipueritiae]MBC9178405.1 tripartite tricarboxylate transporter substrate binding protein [Pseudoroseomonas ludipueritiae]MCG7363272.1 tripartite tricarboxylate transporter substrate binding protein [Roseomonas sp. ACRSG]
MSHLTRRLALTLPLLPLLPGAAAAQPPAWPTRPVSIVVAFAPGGAADVIARILAQRLTEQLGQAVVVDNRVGGGGTVSAALVARSAPDAQTVLLLTSSHAVNESLAKNRGYELERDLTPVVQFAATPYWLFVPPDRPATLAGLLELAKKQPVTFASGGPGGLTHLLGEMLKQETKLDLIHVPYRGNAPAVNDLMAGRVDMLFDNSGTVLEHVRNGKLRVLASTSAERLKATPDVPTMAELGFHDFNVSAWLGLAVPSGTDPALVRRLHEEVAKAMQEPAVRDRLISVGAVPALRGPAEFQALVKAEIPRWAAVIQAGGISAE